MKLWWNLTNSNSLCYSFHKCRFKNSPSTKSSTLKRLKTIRDIADSFIVEIDSTKYWLLSISGDFTTISAWEVIRKVRPSSFLFKFIWKSKIPHKISFFLWKCIHMIIPLEDLIQLKGVKIASVCICCYKDSENFNYLFLDCPIAWIIWSHFSFILGIKISTSSFHQLLMSSWLKKSSKDFYRYLLIIIPGIIFWEIWVSRNKCVFEDIKMDSNNIIASVTKFIISFSYLHFKSSFHHNEELQRLFSLKYSTNSPSFSLVKWSPPKDHLFKMNCDGASKGNPGYSG